MPFYVVYAKTELGVTEEMAGVYIWAMTLGGAVASVVWGYLNDSRGPRAVLRGTTALLIATPLLALSIPAVVSVVARPMPAVGVALPYLFGLVFVAIGSSILVFVAIGSSINALWFGATNYLFDLAGDEDRPRYIGVFHLCTLPATLGAIIIGWLLEHVSFAAVFLLVASCGAGALLSSLRMPKSSEQG
jgi:MFS family permease